LHTYKPALLKFPVEAGVLLWGWLESNPRRPSRPTVANCADEAVEGLEGVHPMIPCAGRCRSVARLNPLAAGPAARSSAARLRFRRVSSSSESTSLPSRASALSLSALSPAVGPAAQPVQSGGAAGTCASAHTARRALGCHVLLTDQPPPPQ
jgi:hypothetical protein